MIARAIGRNSNRNQSREKRGTLIGFGRGHKVRALGGVGA